MGPITLSRILGLLAESGGILGPLGSEGVTASSPRVTRIQPSGATDSDSEFLAAKERCREAGLGCG